MVSSRLFQMGYESNEVVKNSCHVFLYISWLTDKYPRMNSFINLTIQIDIKAYV